MEEALQRGLEAGAGHDKPVLFDHPYWKDPGLRGPLLGLAVTIVVFGGMFAAAFYCLAQAGLPSTDETSRLATVVAGIVVALGIFALWALYGIFGRITVDEDGITYRNIGKHVRIRFHKVTSSSRRWNGAIRIESRGQRITCPGTRAFSACEAYLGERLEGLGQQHAMAAPWNADADTLERLAENREFRHPRFLAVSALVVAVLFSLCAVAFACLEDDLVGAVVSAVMAAAGWVSWYVLSVRVRLDEDGITQSRPGKQTRIEFDAIESAQPKRFFSSEEIVLQSRDRKICVGRDFAYSDFLFHMLFAKIPELNDLEQVELPYTVRTPRYLYVGSGTVAVVSIGLSVFFWVIGADASFALRLALPLMMIGCGLATIAAALKAPVGMVLHADSIFVRYLRKTRTFDAGSLTAVRREQEGCVRVMFGKTKVSFLPNIPSFLMLRILRNIYADQLREAAEEEGRP